MTKGVFTDGDVIKTLSMTRKNTEIREFTGIKYSQLSQWDRSARQAPNKANYYTVLILEYYRRINKQEVAALMKRLNMPKNITDEDLTEMMFPKVVFDKYMESSIQWKNDIINDLKRNNRELLKKQIEILEYFIDANYKMKPKAIIPQAKIDNIIDHL